MTKIIFTNQTSNIDKNSDPQPISPLIVVAGLVSACGTDIFVNATDNLDGTYRLKSKVLNTVFDLILDNRQTRQVGLALLTIETVVDNTNYEVQIGGVGYIFNSGVGATAESIATGLCLAAVGNLWANMIDNHDGTYAVDAKVVDTFFTLGVDPLQKIQFGYIQNSIAYATSNFPYLTQINTVNHFFTPPGGIPYLANGLLQVDISGTLGGADVITYIFGADLVETTIATCSWQSSASETLNTADAGQQVINNRLIGFKIVHAGAGTNINLQYDVE